MTIEEKLNSIRETKEAIKTSIQNKGVELEDTAPFDTYPSKIDEITTEIETENIEITPTKQEQIINRSENKYIESVKVNAIPDEYIIPSGNLNINLNGNYNVNDKASVEVNVQPSLQEKQVYVKPDDNNYIMPDEEYYGLAYVNVIGAVDTENVEVTPTKETQTISRSEKKYIESITINPIPDEYIIPSGELEIIENGNYDVKDKASVNVEIASSGGADLSEYFNINPTEITNEWGTKNFIIKMPDVIIPNNITSLKYMFRYLALPVVPKVICDNNVTDMSYMYCGQTGKYFYPENIDVSGLDTSNVTTMFFMFAYASYLKELDLSNFDTSKVENMGYMFQYNTTLISLDLSNFDTNEVTNMGYMFASCYALENLNITNWNTEKVTSMSNMFYSCYVLDLSILPILNTSNVTDMSSMFRYCKHTTIDISTFDMGEVFNATTMFGNCTSLENLIFGNDLGKNFTRKTTNYSTYKLDFSTCTKLTHDSLMDIINKLYDLNLTYDVANGGTLYTQQLVLGATNIAKLTEEEMVVATAKGWTIS